MAKLPGRHKVHEEFSAAAEPFGHPVTATAMREHPDAGWQESESRSEL